MKPESEPSGFGADEPTWRTFVAIELPDEIKQALTQTQDTLRRDYSSVVRWVHPAGIHLTLKFLGNVASALLPSLEAALQQAAAPLAPFSLSLVDAGVFPNWRMPRVVWVGVGGELQALAALQNRIEQSLADLRFASEVRPFSAHLTLGRVRQEASPEERRALGEAVRALRLPSSPELTVEAVSLMRSELRPGGAIYTRLASFPLGGLAQNALLL